MWGTYWEWDARLTSVLVLFIMYLGLIALWRTIEDPTRGARAAAILILVGSVNLPIIKFSVDWWNTLHQPASVFPHRRSDHRRHHAVAACCHGVGLHRPSRHVASGRHAQRDSAPTHPRPRPDCRRSRPMGSGGFIVFGPYTGFILLSYGAAALAALSLALWVVLDHRRLKHTLAALESAWPYPPFGPRRRPYRARNSNGCQAGDAGVKQPPRRRAKLLALVPLALVPGARGPVLRETRGGRSVRDTLGTDRQARAGTFNSKPSPA